MLRIFSSRRVRATIGAESSDNPALKFDMGQVIKNPRRDSLPSSAYLMTKIIAANSAKIRKNTFRLIAAQERG